MTHLYIELNTGLTEEVNSSIISKLYELAISGDLDETSDLKGRLHITLGYRTPIEYLNNTFLDLYIIADNYVIPFEDPNMLQYLLDRGIGANGGITEALAAAATSVVNSLNTVIKKFNELKYFTSITGPRGGYNATTTGDVRFYNWTALEEVDISNFTVLGHIGSGWEESFRGCTNLKKVTASDKLTIIGSQAFCGCNNLETISGLSGNITVNESSFNTCEKLKLSNFDNVTFSVETGKGTSCFKNCDLLTSLAFDNLVTTIPNEFCYGCDILQTITGLTNVTLVGINAFATCQTLSSIDIDFSKLTSIGNSAFNYCTSLEIANLSCPNLTSLGSSSFQKVKVSKISNLGSIQTLGGSAFNTCTTLTEVTLPSTCTAIDNYAFASCSNLATVNFVNGLLFIGENAFHSCGLTGSIVLPNTLLRIRNGAFQNTKITSISYPASLTLTYGGSSEVDSSTQLKRLNLPTSTTLLSITFEQGFDIPELSINNLKQVSMTVPDTVKFITGVNENGDSTTSFTFSNNSTLEFIGREYTAGLYMNFDFTTDHTLEEYLALCNTDYSSPFRITFTNFPKNNIKMLPRNFLSGFVLNNIPDILGNNVVVIGKECFNKNNMTAFNYSVTLPASLKFVGQSAFRNCAPVSWTFEGTTPPIFEATYRLFSDGGTTASNYSTPIYVPASAVSAYLAAIPEYAHCIQANPNS